MAKVHDLYRTWSLICVTGFTGLLLPLGFDPPAMSCPTPVLPRGDTLYEVLGIKFQQRAAELDEGSTS